MREIAYLILTTPPPLMVSIVFLAAYLRIGIRAHMNDRACDGVHPPASH